MKKNYILLLAGILNFSANSQNTITDFEDLNLQVDSFWNGDDLSGQFVSNQMNFQNNYDTSFGGFWSGVSYSTMRDTSTLGFGNQYSCIAGEGYNSSSTYAIFNPTSDTLLRTSGSVASIEGFWINNSTYAYLSMKNGDSFAKKFGDSTDASGNVDGTNGNDFLKLTIYGENADSVEFYLADFRGSSASDYIIKDWTYVDLSTLDPATRALRFNLTSSDVGAFGMNTPKYFCMDNFEIRSAVSLAENQLLSTTIFPNPTAGVFQVNFGSSLYSGNYKLIDVSGREIISQSFTNQNTLQFDLGKEQKGVYFLSIESSGKVLTKKVIKN